MATPPAWKFETKEEEAELERATLQEIREEIVAAGEIPCEEKHLWNIQAAVIHEALKAKDIIIRKGGVPGPHPENWGYEAMGTSYENGPEYFKESFNDSSSSSSSSTSW